MDDVFVIFNHSMILSLSSTELLNMYIFVQFMLWLKRTQLSSVKDVFNHHQIAAYYNKI